MLDERGPVGGELQPCFLVDREPRLLGVSLALVCCRAVSLTLCSDIHLGLSAPRIVSLHFEGRRRAFDVLQIGIGAASVKLPQSSG